MTTKAPSSQIPSAIQVIFEKNRAQLDQRVSTLEEAVAAMLNGGFSDELRAKAEVDAHKPAFATPAVPGFTHKRARVALLAAAYARCLDASIGGRVRESVIGEGWQTPCAPSSFV